MSKISDAVAKLEGQRWVPTKIAASILGVSKQRVFSLKKEGKLASCKMEGMTMISADSLVKRLTELTRSERLSNGSR